MIPLLLVEKPINHIIHFIQEANNSPHKNKTHKHNLVSTISIKITFIMQINLSMIISTTQIKSLITVINYMISPFHKITINFINMNKTTLIITSNHQNHSLYQFLNTHLKKYKIMINFLNLSIKTEFHFKKTKNSKDHPLTKTQFNKINIHK